jgi:hypothetical protein
LKATKYKQVVINEGTVIRLLKTFSADTCQARKEQHDMFNIMKEKKSCQPRIL